MRRYGYDYGLRGRGQAGPAGPAGPNLVPARYFATYQRGGYSRDFGGAGGSGAYGMGGGWDRVGPGFGPSAGYGRGGYDGEFAARPRSLPNRVTASYNRDYVRDQGERYPENYTPYGGDRIGRVGDMREYQRPYQTVGGTRTWRGGGWPMDWAGDEPRYDRDYRGYGRDFGRRY